MGARPGWGDRFPVLSGPDRASATSRAHALGSALATRHPAERSVPLAAAVGEVLSRDVFAPRAVPHYTSSAMDGYAVSGPAPWRVIPPDPAVHDAAATAAIDLRPGQAVPVVTGGVIPRGTVTVIRDEFATRVGNRLDLRDGAPRSELTGRHLRPAGGECAAGDLVAGAGARLSPGHVAFAAVTGLDTLPVRPAPSVHLLLTGSEVRSSGIPEPGFVRDAFSPALPSALAGLGAQVDGLSRIPDDAGAFAAALDSAVAQHAALVITTGGTARSRADHVRAHLEQHGTLLIDELDLQPGHPTLCAALGPRAAILALPGNPLAAMTALAVVGVPLIRGYLGQQESPERLGIAGQDMAGSRRERLVPAQCDPDGTWRPCRASGPNMLRGLSQAEALLSVPRRGLHAGERTHLVALPWAPGF